jgi:hypothetical protein
MIRISNLKLSSRELCKSKNNIYYLNFIIINNLKMTDPIKLKIIARVDCLNLAALKYIIDDYNKKSKNGLEVNYEIHFETYFNIYRDTLIRQNIEPSLIVSPIIYLVSVFLYI